jgi:hypothetical protein
MQRYAASPLVRKLGIRAGMRAAAIAAPDGFEELLGDLPEGATLGSRMRPDTALAIWFVRSLREVEAAVDAIADRSAWIVYPKQTGKYRTDFSMNDIRALCREAGLIDCKICAVDQDWTALRLARKKL